MFSASYFVKLALALITFGVVKFGIYVMVGMVVANPQ